MFVSASAGNLCYVCEAELSRNAATLRCCTHLVAFGHHHDE